MNCRERHDLKQSFMNWLTPWIALRCIKILGNSIHGGGETPTRNHDAKHQFMTQSVNSLRYARANADGKSILSAKLNKNVVPIWHTHEWVTIGTTALSEIIQFWMIKCYPLYNTLPRRGRCIIIARSFVLRNSRICYNRLKEARKASFSIHRASLVESDHPQIHHNQWKDYSLDNRKPHKYLYTFLFLD